MKLDDYSLDELKELKAKVDSEITNRIEIEKAEFVNNIKERAEYFGVSLDELLREAGKKSTAIVKPKYQNPNNEKEVWSGRGRKPKWLKALLDQGKTLESFEI